MDKVEKINRNKEEEVKKGDCNYSHDVNRQILENKGN